LEWGETREGYQNQGSLKQQQTNLGIIFYRY